MAQYLRQSTASQEILLGPFVDDTDGKTAETGLTISNTDIKLFKSGGTSFTDKNSGGATHISSGWYYAVLDATDTNTVGNLEVVVNESGALPVRREYVVLEEAVYDALFASSALGYVANAPVNVAQFGGSNLTSASGIPEVKVASLANNAITAASINADAITAAKIADGAIDAATLASDTITAAKIADNAITAAKLNADAITAAKLAADVTTEIQSGLATASALSTVDGKIDTIDTTADAIKAKTDSLTFTVAGNVDANTQYVNDVGVTGDGEEGTPWGPV